MIKASRFFLVLGCIWVFSTCSKKQLAEVDSETQCAIDYAIADQEFMSVIPSIVQSALQTPALGNAVANLCDTLTFTSGDTSDFVPNLVYGLDVATANCSSMKSDGKSRTGKITIRFTGKINVKGSEAIIKVSNYKAADVEYSCDSIVLKVNSSTATMLELNVRLKGAICKTNANTIKFEFDRTVVVYPKGETGNTVGVCYFYGTASGTNQQGINFSTVIEQPTNLVKHANCMFIEKGLLKLTPEGFKTREINFGEGNCDNEATFTVNENTVAFKLK